MRTSTQKFTDELVRIKLTFDEPLSISNKNYFKTRLRCNMLLKVASRYKLDSFLWENPFSYSRGRNVVIDLDTRRLTTQRSRNNFKKALMKCGALINNVDIQLVTIETNRKTITREG